METTLPKSGGVPKYQLIVNTDAGATITATKGTETRTAKEKNGACYFKNLTEGEWMLSLSGDTPKSKRVIISDTKKCIFTHLYRFSGIISVTYPEGSKCTCKKGDLTIYAEGTFGNFEFVVYESGDWIVSCNNGLSGDEYEEASETVIITEDGQVKSVELSYVLYIFKNGRPVAEYGFGSASVRSDKKATATEKADYTTYISPDSYTGPATNVSVDLTEYNTLVFDMEQTSTSSKPGIFSTINNSGTTGVNNALKAYKQATTGNGRTQYNLDISSFSGGYYVGIYLDGSGNKSANLYNIWLE